MSPPDYYSHPLEYYNDKNQYYILVGEDIEGDTFDTLEEWYACPYKYEIMEDAMKFKNYLRKISRKTIVQKMLGIEHKELGRCHNYSHIINIPILDNFINEYMGYLIIDYEKAINDTPGYSISRYLIHSDIGKSILHELKHTGYSDLVFCHNYLCYKSFVIKNNKLIGIRNWQYAGFYPPEFEDIIHKYLEFI